MEVLKRILTITNSLNELLIAKVEAKDRDQTIEEVNELLAKRELLLQQMKQAEDLTEDEKRIGKQIIKLNQAVEQGLNLLFSEIKNEIQAMQKQKKFKQNYTNPYENVQLADGMFLDSKQ